MTALGRQVAELGEYGSEVEDEPAEEPAAEAAEDDDEEE